METRNGVKSLSEIIPSDYEELNLEMILTDDEKRYCLMNKIQNTLSDIRFRRKQYTYVYQEYDLKTDEGLIKTANMLGIDVDSVYKFHNRRKHGEIQAARYRQDRMEEEEKRMIELKKYWDAKRCYKHMLQTSFEYNTVLIVNEANINFIKALCFKVSKDNRFESELNLSFKKGMIVQGDYGRGKSYLIKLLKDNGIIPFSIHSMLDIEEAVNKEGMYELNLTNDKITVIEDLGVEAIKQNHYKNSFNWFEKWVLKMYEQEKPFENLIITTNLNADEIEERYTGRVRSRLAQRMNLLTLTGEDMRRM